MYFSTLIYSHTLLVSSVEICFGPERGRKEIYELTVCLGVACVARCWCLSS